jgi:hypothetical protein
MAFRVYSASKGKETDAWTGIDTEPDTIAHCLRHCMTISWVKERRRIADTTDEQWHFVRLTPDIPCSHEGFAKIQSSIQSLFDDKRAEWNAKKDADLTSKAQSWTKLSWNNRLTFVLTNQVHKDGSLNPYHWDKYLVDRNILRLARECFPGTSYKELDSAGGFYGDATDEDGRPMTLETAANAPTRTNTTPTSIKKYD